ncbi:MAG TPA: FAD-dependent oxidoreductase [Bacteroidales bacterium]|nr:FAD-dependent oxidoreductase [Bacteroidales bacterium]
MQYDFIIVGGGIGGLICGCLLAKEGYKVCILEKHYAIGGGLHVFKKHNKTFETGIHYVSGFSQDQVLSKIFNYLQVLGNFKMKDLDSEAFDILHIGEDNCRYKLGSGEENFINGLAEHFPDERENLKRYISSIKELSKKFYLFNLEPRETELFSMDDELTQPVGKYIDQFFVSEKLKRVVAWNNSLYAGIFDKTPAYVHILISKFYLEGATRFVDGPQQLADNMVSLIRSVGGDVYTSSEVAHIDVSDKEIKRIILSDGRTYEAKNYISAIHPALTLEMIDPGQIQKAYRNRITSLKNTTSVFTIFITFRKESFPYLNYNYYYSPSYDSIWKASQYTEENWPQGMMLLTPPTSGEKKYAEKMIVNCIMNFDDVRQWENTSTGRRGDDYISFKRRCTDKVLAILKELFPGIDDNIDSMSASTPLTIRDYTGSKDGSLYGIEKDCNNLLNSHIVPRTKINNLYLTGQNINLHGIIGVALSAILTAGEFVGINYLINKINEDYKSK